MNDWQFNELMRRLDRIIELLQIAQQPPPDFMLKSSEPPEVTVRSPSAFSRPQAETKRPRGRPRKDRA